MSPDESGRRRISEILRFAQNDKERFLDDLREGGPVKYRHPYADFTIFLSSSVSPYRSSTRVSIFSSARWISRSNSLCLSCSTSETSASRLWSSSIFSPKGDLPPENSSTLN